MKLWLLRDGTSSDFSYNTKEPEEIRRWAHVHENMTESLHIGGKC
jgi:hypothetical protein